MNNKKSFIKKWFLLFSLIPIPFVVQSQVTTGSQSNKLIYNGTFTNELYTYGKTDIETQQKTLQAFDAAIVSKALEEWDVNISDSWSINHPSYSKQQPTIKSDSARKNYMISKTHIEFYPKSGTAIMNEYLKREQQSNENEKAVKQDLYQKKITNQEAQTQLQKLDADIWGAPSHIDIITNDFPLSDSAFIKNPQDENISDWKEIKIPGADFATVCKQSRMGNTFWVTTLYLGKYSQDKNGNLQLQHPNSSQWEKQYSVKMKIYGPPDVALMLLKKFDLEKLKTILK